MMTSKQSIEIKLYSLTDGNIEVWGEFAKKVTMNQTRLRIRQHEKNREEHFRL